MKGNAVFSHKSDMWKTPREIYELYKSLNYFDPCPVNPTFDRLKIDWTDRAFVNPPYSQIAKWVDKALQEARKGTEIRLLVPARTDTKWFSKIYNYGARFLFVKGRIHFNDTGPAPFPSVLIIIHEKYKYNSQIDVSDILI